MLERFLKNSFNYWFFFILTGILSFGYALTHSAMGIDDEILETWSQFYILLGLNRLGLYITRKLLIANEYIPFLREFLFVLVYMFAINIYAKLFEENFPKIFSETAKTIYSCIMLVFPFVGFLFCFMDTNLEYGLSFLFSAIAIYYFYNSNLCNKKKKYIIIFISLFISISFYETGIIYFMMAVLAFSMFKIITNEDKNKIGYDLVNSFLLCVASLFTNWCILFFIRKILGFSKEERIYELIKYNFSSINSLIISFKEIMVKFLNNFIETCRYDSASKIILISCFIFFLIIIFYSIKINRKILPIGIIFFLLPLVPLFLTGNYEFYYRVYSPYSIFCAISFVLLYTMLKKNNILRKIFLIIVFFVVFSLIQEINRIFYTEYLKFQNDRMFAYSLYQEVLKLGDKPLLIIGVKDNPKLNRNYYIEAPEINVSIFNWDRYDSFDSELFVNRPYAFMKEQGFEVKAYKDFVHFTKKEDYEDFIKEVSKISKAMTIYPKDGSIKDCGDFILIKIGKSKFDYNN